MKIRVCIALLLLAVLSPFTLSAQEKQEKPEAAKAPRSYTELKVQVTLTEFDGEKKIGSLPYVVQVAASDAFGPEARLRMGLRVPITTVANVNTGANQIQYFDVGTDIDCGAMALPDGRFRLSLKVERSSLYTPDPERKLGDLPSAAQTPAQAPIVRRFSADLSPLLRDGETVQTTMATDPVSGRVLKVDVTVNVVK